MNKWKESAYQKFEELEKLGCLIPDHVMINGQPVPVSPKNDASHSIQANPTCFNHQIALEGLLYIHYDPYKILVISFYSRFKA